MWSGAHGSTHDYRARGPGLYHLGPGALYYNYFLYNVKAVALLTSIQYMAPGFQPTLSWLWVVSLKHYTMASRLKKVKSLVFFLNIFLVCPIWLPLFFFFSNEIASNAFIHPVTCEAIAGWRREISLVVLLSSLAPRPPSRSQKFYKFFLISRYRLVSIGFSPYVLVLL